jgi:hypothetical protein
MESSIRESLADFEREFNDELEKSKKSTFVVLSIIVPTGVGYGSTVGATAVADTAYNLGIPIIFLIFVIYHYEFGTIKIIREVIKERFK